MSLSEPGREFKSPGRNWMLPILATGIRFGDSQDIPQLQVADLVSGATAAVLARRVRKDNDRFLDDLQRTKFGQLSYAYVWPELSSTTSDDDSNAGTLPSDALDFVTGLYGRAASRGGVDESTLTR